MGGVDRLPGMPGMPGMPDSGEEGIHWVTAREFGKNVAAVLDLVQFQRRTVVVTRYGRRAAMLIPLDELSRVPRPITSPTPDPEPPPQIADPLELRIYEEAVTRKKVRPEDFGGDVMATVRALSRLEMAGLIQKEWGGGYRLLPRASRR